MAEAISNCLLYWNLDKVFSVTVDNASSNDVTVRELSKQLNMWGTNIMDGKHLHVRCMAHILNLIVHEGLKEIDASVKRVRQMVRYVRSSSTEGSHFKKCCEVQRVDCSKTLELDVPTRWNSTYLMLDTAQNFEKAFDRFDLFDENFNNYLSTHVLEDGSVAGSHYVTSNVHFEDICELDVYLKVCLASEDLNLSKMAERMREKFKKYWGDPEKMNKMIFIASVLDPRNKFVYVSFGLEELFGEEVGKKVSEGVYDYMKSLFVEYLKNYSREFHHKSSPSASSSSRCSYPMYLLVRHLFESKSFEN
ncbi:zinc finger BED domain-containing protein RICESLEEPER 2-like [Lycium ferocissimum]|uniref:zinc finger BED domain-containing protein RICESLEEPER 2-like n=1 Tax=Lycium ferocissimum TaxID=112874 RepID=UPI002815E99F|nr:zinc finger BED domain-containing protein RICESLEEPER 2-like [Lycium ferocissimum]